MKRAPQCFYCHRFARVEDCILLRNKNSGIRRWFHRKGIKPYCDFDPSLLRNWEEVDRSLGETTDEEMRRMLSQGDREREGGDASE